MRYCSASNQDNSDCTNPATRKVSCFWVCDMHGAYNYNYIRNNSLDRVIYHLVENGDLRRHTFGITYFIQLPNGNIKIGFTKNQDTLIKRMVTLRREFGDVKIISTLWGGETLEAYYHYKYRNNRLFNEYLEQFSPHGIIDGIKALGNIHPGVAAQNHLRSNFSANPTEARRANVRKVACPKCAANVGEKCVSSAATNPGQWGRSRDDSRLTRESNHAERAKAYSTLLRHDAV